MFLRMKVHCIFVFLFDVLERKEKEVYHNENEGFETNIIERKGKRFGKDKKIIIPYYPYQV